MRGPGGVGTASMGTNIGRYYLYVNNHNKQTLTERLDWRSSFGYGEGGADARKKLDLPGGGPRFCITPLCIFDFEEQTKRMRLKSVHPGVTVEQVLASTGFTADRSRRGPDHAGADRGADRASAQPHRRGGRAAPAVRQSRSSGSADAGPWAAPAHS